MTEKNASPDAETAEAPVTQDWDQGTGPLLERRYWVDIQHPRLSRAELLADIKTSFADYAPDLLAAFEKSEGRPEQLRVGDEFDIRILGPWNGAVRVTDVTADAFEFVTLEGHPEAGRIRFSLTEHEDFDDTLHFEIRSEARSRDGLVAFTYDTLGVGKRVQQQVWVTFCQRVCEKAGGEPLGDVQVRDRVLHDNPDEAPDLSPGDLPSAQP